MNRVVYAALILTCLASPALAQEHGDARAGRALALSACANCHLVAEGQSKPPMDSVPSFDAIAHNQAMTEQRLRVFLNKPHWPMPDLQLSRQQIEDEIAFIGELRGGSR